MQYIRKEVSSSAEVPLEPPLSVVIQNKHFKDLTKGGKGVFFKFTPNAVFLSGKTAAVEAAEERLKMLLSQLESSMSTQTVTVPKGLKFAISSKEVRFYELRDETATLESIELIAASAMSKKLAEDLNGLIVDVKVSQDSLLSGRTEARRLAQQLISIGRKLGVKVQVLLTDMEQPLGHTVGNALEIMEVSQTLQGQGPTDLSGLAVELAARMIYISDTTISMDDAREKAASVIEDGSALQVLASVIGAQGGDPDVLTDFVKLPNPQGALPITSPRDGYVSKINAEDIGRAAVLLGGGWPGPGEEGQHDPAVGIVIEAKVGQQVFNNTGLCSLYYNDDTNLEEAQQLVEDAFRISSMEPQQRNLVIDVIQG